MNNIVLPFLAASLALSFSQAATASTIIYDNGAATQNDTNAFLINDGNVVSDSFTLTNASTFTGVNFWVWNAPGETTSQIDWSLSSGPFSGTSYGSGTANLTSLNEFTNQFGYDVNEYNFSTGSVNLIKGTYYLNLQNAVVTNGDPAYWSENDGASAAFATGIGSLANFSSPGSTGSEAFQIQGSVVPEPSGLILLTMGSLFVGLCTFRKRQSMTLSRL